MRDKCLALIVKLNKHAKTVSDKVHIRNDQVNRGLGIVRDFNLDYASRICGAIIIGLTSIKNIGNHPNEDWDKLYKTLTKMEKDLDEVTKFI